MSVLEPRRENATPAVAPATPAFRAGFWLRVFIACGLLAASALVRARQAERIDRALQRGMESPITLEDVPMNLGPWHGESAEIDSEIAKGTGALQLVTRRYVNQSTGVSVELILLFGKAVNIYMHTPEVCYPSAGFALDAPMMERQIPVGDVNARFRTLVYGKGEGTRAEHQEVYYSWWYDGHWTPTVGALKHFERVSGMYKVQVARLIPAGEAIDAGGPTPTESFLKELLPEIQRRLEERSAPAS